MELAGSGRRRQTIARLRPILYVENDRTEEKQLAWSASRFAGLCDVLAPALLFQPDNFFGESGERVPRYRLE